MKYDAAIVGAGIAGLYAGWKLAAAGWSVCIVDRRKEIGVPVRCGEATGSRAELARFLPVDESWIARDIRGLAAHLNGSCVVSKPIQDAGVVLHRDRFEKSLAQRAADAGARILLQRSVTSLRGDGGTRSLELDGREFIGAAVVLGADGCESKVGRWAGITRHLRAHDAYTSAQYRVTSRFCNDGMLHFFVGSQTIPGGYIWVFPKSEETVSVGAGLYGCDTPQEKALVYLERFIERHMGGAPRSMLISGCVPLAVCPRRLHRGTVAVVGDAARQCNPLSAGGIMNSLEAADLLVRHLLAGQPSSAGQRLSAYSKAWSGKPRREQKVFAVAREIFASSTDRDAERTLRLCACVFAGPLDRSRPFSWPVLPLLRLAAVFAPAVARRWRVLAQ